MPQTKSGLSPAKFITTSKARNYNASHTEFCSSHFNSNDVAVNAGRWSGSTSRIQQPIAVRPIHDEKAYGAGQQPVSVTISKSFFMHFGEIRASITLDRSAIVPGEAIKVHMAIQNETSRKVTLASAEGIRRVILNAGSSLPGVIPDDIRNAPLVVVEGAEALDLKRHQSKDVRFELIWPRCRMEPPHPDGLNHPNAFTIHGARFSVIHEIKVTLRAQSKKKFEDLHGYIPILIVPPFECNREENISCVVPTFLNWNEAFSKRKPITLPHPRYQCQMVCSDRPRPPPKAAPRRPSAYMTNSDILRGGRSEQPMATAPAAMNPYADPSYINGYAPPTNNGMPLPSGGGPAPYAAPPGSVAAALGVGAMQRPVPAPRPPMTRVDTLIDSTPRRYSFADFQMERGATPTQPATRPPPATISAGTSGSVYPSLDSFSPSSTNTPSAFAGGTFPRGRPSVTAMAGTATLPRTTPSRPPPPMMPFRTEMPNAASRSVSASGLGYSASGMYGSPAVPSMPLPSAPPAPTAPPAYALGIF
eukprot:Opistho-2@17930